MKNLLLILILIVIVILPLIINKKSSNVSEAFTIVPMEQTIEIDDLDVKPNLIVIMPNTVITWKNISKHSIKLFIKTETEQKMVVIDPNESWSYPYKIIRQYDYVGIRIFNNSPTTIGKVNQSINGRIIVTGI